MNSDLYKHSTLGEGENDPDKKVLKQWINPEMESVELMGGIEINPFEATPTSHT